MDKNRTLSRFEKKKQTAYVEYPRGVHNIFWKTYFRERNFLWKFLLIFIEFHLKNVCPFQDGGFSWKLHSFLKHFFEKIFITTHNTPWTVAAFLLTNIFHQKLWYSLKYCSIHLRNLSPFQNGCFKLKLQIVLGKTCCKLQYFLKCCIFCIFGNIQAFSKMFVPTGQCIIFFWNKGTV